VLLRDFLREKGSTAVCELIEGRSHGDLIGRTRNTLMV
jgi:hypothetical protein